ncbi:hypothetical protein [Alicyclobacillus dauci]|uniref:Uncharacterized protein n=1 Tax=Alicyclobacillus dauci TaxID=1475485 RepID=A0ABY6Z304_9BACL|nr:hypothetical protein [Alicyclobacillus dauci]WAH37279.1 hypothetical protein NZD86_01655 [Alicyclobacillus dauci]
MSESARDERQGFPGGCAGDWGRLGVAGAPREVEEGAKEGNRRPLLLVFASLPTE